MLSRNRTAKYSAKMSFDMQSVIFSNLQRSMILLGFPLGVSREEMKTFVSITTFTWPSEPS